MEDEEISCSLIICRYVAVDPELVRRKEPKAMIHNREQPRAKAETNKETKKTICGLVREYPI